MDTLNPRRIPNVVFGLCGFWLVIVSCFYLDSWFNLKFIPFWLLSILLGALFSEISSDKKLLVILNNLKCRHDKILPLTDRSAFLNSSKGLVSFIGPIPLHYYGPQKKIGFTYAELVPHLPPEVTKDTFFGLLSRFGYVNKTESSISFATLFDEVAKIYLHDSHIGFPAGIDKHKNRSLISHNLLVCALMMHQAPTYKYNPQSFSPIDENYKLPSDDCLIPLIGFCHDIGKIECFNFDASGIAESLTDNHDSCGARILATITEYWDNRISSSDRHLFHSVIAYYHNTIKIPVAGRKDGRIPRVTSDRLHALVGLLIQGDRHASSIESGTKYDFVGAYDVPIVEDAPVDLANNQELFASFTRYISTFAEINAGRGSKSVGFKYSSHINERFQNYVYIDEKEFALSFCAFIKHPEFGMIKEGRSSPITSIILRLLDQNSILVRGEKEFGKRSAETCLYKIDFFSGTEIEPSFRLKSAFVIDISDLSGMNSIMKMENCQSRPVISSCIFGAQGVSHTSTNRKSALDNLAEEIVTGAPKRQTGVSIENLISNAKPTSRGVVQQIKLALLNKTIHVVHTKDVAVDIPVIGFDDFFAKLGVNPEKYVDRGRDDDKVLANAGISLIRKSKSSADSHVVFLSKSIYGNL